jgi:Fur family transcriptional regulator, ferric uptake regulator
MAGWILEAREQLRDTGHRNGAARTRLLEALDDQTCCLSAAELREAVNASGWEIGLASVYRTLDVLVEHGLVQRVDLGDGIARYEPVHASREHHHHLVCDDCGRVEPFVDPGLERSIERVEATSGYHVSAHDVVLRGACNDCRPSR